MTHLSEARETNRGQRTTGERVIDSGNGERVIDSGNGASLLRRHQTWADGGDCILCSHDTEEVGA